VLFGLTLVIIAQLHAVTPPARCFGAVDVHGPPGSSDAICQRLLAAFEAISGNEADRLFLVFAVFPALAGMLLGVPIVSREIEESSASLPWTLSGRRRRWLTWRSTELLAVLLVVLIPLALVGDALEAAKNPLLDPASSFADDSVRGIVVVARGACGLAVGIVLGLVTGRQLPAVILGLVAAVAIVVGGLLIASVWSQAVASYITPDRAHFGDLSIRSALRGHDGRIVSQAEVLDLQPPNPSLPPGTVNDRWIAANFDEVLLVVPGSRYHEQELVQSGVLLGAGALAFVLALVMIDRRRVR